MKTFLKLGLNPRISLGKMDTKNSSFRAAAPPTPDLFPAPRPLGANSGARPSTAQTRRKARAHPQAQRRPLPLARSGEYGA